MPRLVGKAEVQSQSPMTSPSSPLRSISAEKSFLPRVPDANGEAWLSAGVSKGIPPEN